VDTQAPHPNKNWWVISFLVTGDESGVMAVSAEGLIRSTLWEHEGGSQPLAAAVERFGDQSPGEQEEWRRAVQRGGEDWRRPIATCRYLHRDGVSTMTAARGSTRPNCR
jgi:hypothetical protein